MVRHLDGEEGHGRRTEYITALLHHRRPSPVDDDTLLKRIESKTAQHRSPYSANISRKHASILAAMSPPGGRAPRAGRRRALTPTREASRRQAFEVFEWDRDFEPVEPPPGDEGEVPGEEVWDTPPEPRPALTKYLAHLSSGEGGKPEPGDAEEEPQAVEEAGPEEQPGPLEGQEPEVIPEAEELVDESILEAAQAIAESSEGEREEKPREEPKEAPGPEPVPGPEVETTPPTRKEVVVEGRPGHRPREGGEFPVELMEPLDEAAPEDATRPDRPHRGEEVADVTVLSYEHETDMSEDEDVTPGETETPESVMGISPSRRWPSDTGLELHIDGFEHMAAASDLCPRCGRRISTRNRLLTCNDCGAVACESCEIRTTSDVDSPYYYDWHFELPLCVNCYEKAFNIQKAIAKAKSALGMGNHTYAYFHAQQALRTDPDSPYAEEAEQIISQVDRRRRETAEQDEAWKRQRAKLSRTTVFRED